MATRKEEQEARDRRRAVKEAYEARAERRRHATPPPPTPAEVPSVLAGVLRDPDEPGYGQVHFYDGPWQGDYS